MKKYFCILKLFLTLSLTISTLLFTHPLLPLASLIKSFTPLKFAHGVLLALLQNLVVLSIALMAVQYVAMCALAVGTDSVAILLLELVLMVPMDVVLASLMRRGQKEWVTLDREEQIKMVYMRRAMVTRRTVDLNMGELVQFVGREGVFVVVRKFNEEEFKVDENDIVDDIEDVVL